MHKRVLILALCWLMAACGGGGGGSSETGAPTYVGKTNQAAVNASNARALSVDAFTGSQLSSSFAELRKEVPLVAGQPSLVLDLCSLVQDSVTNVVSSQKSSAKGVAATAQETVNGYRGSYTYTVQVEPGSSSFSGTITLSQYQENSASVTLSGTLRISGPLTFTQSGDAEPVVIEFSNLTGTLGTQSLTLNGGMTYVSTVTSQTVTISMLVTDNVANLTYWIKDYLLKLTGNQLTISGTYHHPVHGFVVMTTATPLNVSDIDAWPGAGQLLFSGSNGTKARLTFAGTGYLLEVDAAGNGSYATITP